LGLFASAQTTLSDTSASAYASSIRSIGLTAITDTAGNPISGVTFDSGLALVPEPGTWALVVCGLATLLVPGIGRRRKR
jgi:hypothetical protein